jgi:predicted dienelactone hydrolase
MDTWMKGIVLAVLGTITGVVAVGCGGSVSVEPALTTAALLEPGPAGVGSTTMTFVDDSRPTMANGTFPGAPSRTLQTEIWYPTDPGTTPSEQEQRNAPFMHDGQRHPLVIYSHGFLDSRRGEAYLAAHLASNGYIVASPDYPLTNFNAPGGANLADLPNQPGDVSFLIDQLLNLDASASGLLSGTIDHDRIGATGLSLGGTTTLLVAFHPTLRDPRVRAAAPIAPGACFLGKDFYDDRHIPLLLVEGSIDAISPYQQNGAFAFGEANPPKYLATIANGSHTGFSGAATSVIFRGVNNPDEIGCSALGGVIGNGDSTPNLIDLLGGAAAGLIIGDCPLPCAGAGSLPEAIDPARQHGLTEVGVLSFFEAELRGSARARQFLEQTLAAENPDIAVQSTNS